MKNLQTAYLFGIVPISKKHSASFSLLILVAPFLRWYFYRTCLHIVLSLDFYRNCIRNSDSLRQITGFIAGKMVFKLFKQCVDYAVLWSLFKFNDVYRRKLSMVNLNCNANMDSRRPLRHIRRTQRPRRKCCVRDLVS